MRALAQTLASALASALACALAAGGAPALAQGADAVDFGVDDGPYAGDGECDDPRFTGPGASGFSTEYELRDATDCHALYDAGLIAMYAPRQIALRSFTGEADGIDFGLNDGEFVTDGECDDPRFFGEKATGAIYDEEDGHDAADCHALYRAGLIRLLTAEELERQNFEGVIDGIDFGDNSGEFARDEECDDPRFEGEGASGGFGDMLMRDAADCYVAYLDGTVVLRARPDGGDGAPFTMLDGDLAAAAADIDFGDDEGAFANDGECDDPRFEGEGMYEDGSASHVLRDAADCRAQFLAGRVRLRSDDALQAAGLFTGLYDGLDFGDNEGAYGRDGECDDPRFAGPGTSGGRFDDHVMHDAADCQTAYAAGRAWLAQHGVNPNAARFDGVDFGDNLGEFPDDGICDDPRFDGEGMGQTALLPSDARHDARDCLTAWLDGTLTLKAPEQDSDD